jgi:heat shock protein HtpX
MNAQLKTILLLAVLSALVVAVGGSLGPAWMWGAVALALGMNLFAYFFSDRLVLRMAGAREVSLAEAPALHADVAELASAARIPRPRVYVIDAPYANAFATGRDPRHAAVAVTSGILEILDRRELRAVLAHEIGHIVNRDVLVATVAAGLATAISHLANVLAFSGLFGAREEEEGSPAGGLLFMLVAPIGATLVQMGISRSREFLADETGARLSRDPLALASALAKLQASAEAAPSAEAQPAAASLYIVNPFGALGGLVKLFSTHPPAEERIRRLRAMAGVASGAALDVEHHLARRRAGL